MENLIKVGYDSRTNLYAFKTPGGYNAKNVCINGESITDPLLGQKVGELMTTTKRPDVITFETSTRELVGYKNEERDVIVSIKEYQDTLNVIESTRDYDEEGDGEFQYNSIEDEVFATRFFRNHVATYQHLSTVHSMDIEFISYPVSEYSNIIPLYSMDARNIFDTKCKYIPNTIQTFKDLCIDRGIDDSRIHIPTHSGLRYAKLDDKYISGMEEFEKTSNREIIAPYDECVAKMSLMRFNLTKLLNFHFAKQSQNVLDESTVGNLLTQLQNLQNSVNKLDVKVKDESSQRSVSQRIKGLIEIYKNLA